MQQQIKLILNLAQIFIHEQPQLFIERLEREPKIIDSLFQNKQQDERYTCEGFFKAYSS